jgi:hypothetical protein
VFSDAAKATGRLIRQKMAAYLKGKITEIETNSQRNNVQYVQRTLASIVIGKVSRLL